MAAVGRGEMKASDVARAMYPDYKEERAALAATPKYESGWFGLREAQGRSSSRCRKRRSSGSDPDAWHQQRPAGALRAEWRRGAGRPHRRHPARRARALPSIRSSRRRWQEFEDTPERWLDVRWDMDERDAAALPGPASPCSRSNEPGSLAQIAQVIAEHDGNIDNIHMTRQSPDFTACHHRSRGL